LGKPQSYGYHGPGACRIRGAAEPKMEGASLRI
jgi:hypothetical protein